MTTEPRHWHLSNGTGRHDDDPFKRTFTLAELDTQLAPMLDWYCPRGTVWLNWPEGHVVPGKHSSACWHALNQVDPKYADRLRDILSVYPTNLFEGVAHFDNGRWRHPRITDEANIRALPVMDNASTLRGKEFVQLLSSEVVYKRPDSVPERAIIEAFWSGPEWQHTHDAIGLASWFLRWVHGGGTIPEGRRAYIIDDRGSKKWQAIEDSFIEEGDWDEGMSDMIDQALAQPNVHCVEMISPPPKGQPFTPPASTMRTSPEQDGGGEGPPEPDDQPGEQQ